MPDSIFVDNSRRRHGCLLFFLQQVEDQVNSQKDESEIEVLKDGSNYLLPRSSVAKENLLSPLFKPAGKPP